MHLKGICLYKILLFAIYTRRVLFHLSFYTNTYTAHLRVLYVYMFMIYLCACRYTYTTFIHIHCMRLAFVNVAFLLHGIISHILIHTLTLTQRERERHSRTDYKVVVATFRRMLFASCSECRKSSPAKATATATAAGKNTKIKLIYCIHRTVFVCVCVRVQAVFLPSLN